jgi:hypothetical protein
MTKKDSKTSGTSQQSKSKKPFRHYIKKADDGKVGDLLILSMKTIIISTRSNQLWQRCPLRSTVT